MPRLACLVCGKTIWSTVPLVQLFADERRCPRCGAALQDDRRKADRRVMVRRQRSDGPAGGERRRLEERRLAQRRKIETRSTAGPYGWR